MCAARAQGGAGLWALAGGPGPGLLNTVDEGAHPSPVTAETGWRRLCPVPVPLCVSAVQVRVGSVSGVRLRATHQASGEHLRLLPRGVLSGAPSKSEELETQGHTLAARQSLAKAPLCVCCFLWGALGPGWVSQGGIWVLGPGAWADPACVDRIWQVHLLLREAAAPRVPAGDLTVLGLSVALHAPASVWTVGSGAVCGWAPSLSHCWLGEAGCQAQRLGLCVDWVLTVPQWDSWTSVRVSLVVTNPGRGWLQGARPTQGGALGVLRRRKGRCIKQKAPPPPIVLPS